MLTLTRKKQAVVVDPRKQLEEYQLYHSERAILYVNTIALRQLVSRGEDSLIFQLGLSQSENSLSPANAVGALLASARNNYFHEGTGAVDGKTLAALRTMLQVAETSDEFKAAVREYEPLLQAVADLNAARSERDRQRCLAEAAVRAAEEDARARALASVENDPAVQDAKEALKQL